MTTRIAIALIVAGFWFGLLGSFARATPGDASGDPGVTAKLPPPAAKKVDFVEDIQPILESACYECHGADTQEGGLRLHHRDSALAGGDQGKSILPGKSAESRLVQYLVGIGKQMPPEDYDLPLEARDVALIRAWIDQGAVWPDEAAGEAPTSDHWAYQPPVRADLPQPHGADWCRQPLDHFVLARLQTEGLTPSPPADKAKWLRRVSLDLIGLPPTPKQLDAFLADDSDQAYEKVVDRLLASPRFGERWAAWWLDLARYADTQGYEKDNRRTIWRYRDWVIQAFNADMPFDQFTVEQIAGDMLENPTTDQMIATAFHRNTMTNTEGGTDDEEFRTAAVVDRVNTTFSVWMATTFGCCQCHSHKYDPFTQKEYYQFFAILNQTEDADRNNEHPVMPTPTAEQAARQQHLRKQIAELKTEIAPQEEPPAEPREESAEIAKLRTEIAHLEKQLKAIRPPTTPIMRELPPNRQRTTHVMIRGNFLNKGDVVQPAVPAVLNDVPQGSPVNRLTAARWLVDDRNPLTARVLVNRLWEQLFGTGIVETSEDFGTRGSKRSHPELLDYLAVELMQEGWSIKRTLRRMVLSATYRQDSRVPPSLLENDPYNRLLARGPRFRLTAEQLRDQSLAVSGLLSDKMLGPSVMPPQPDNIWSIVYSGDKWVTAKGEDRYRRAVYTFWRRTSPYPSMMAFDTSSREVCELRRKRTNTPLQALVTLNDPAFVETAQALARKTVAAGGDDTKSRLVDAYRRTLSRVPTDREINRLSQLYEAELAHYREHVEDARLLATDPLGPLPEGMDAAELAAWTSVANVILNLDEFVTKE